MKSSDTPARFGVLAPRVAAIVAMTCTLVGCGIVGERDVWQVRDDAEPIVKRIPEAAIMDSVVWIAGPLSDERFQAPGPESYRIDVIGSVSVDDVDALQSTYVFQAHSGAPEVSPEISGSLSDGPWLRSDDLDYDWTEFPWYAEVYLDPDDAVIVLKIVGGN